MSPNLFAIRVCRLLLENPIFLYVLISALHFVTMRSSFLRFKIDGAIGVLLRLNETRDVTTHL